MTMTGMRTSALSSETSSQWHTRSQTTPRHFTIFFLIFFFWLGGGGGGACSPSKFLHLNRGNYSDCS